MKRLFILFAVFAAATVVSAQEQGTAQKAPEGKWSSVTTPALKFSESMFNNWSSTGTSQLDLNVTFFGNYKYTHPRYVWDNVADLGFGQAWQDLDNSAQGGRFESRRKSLDKIDLTSTISWKAYKDWGASFLANLKTQFTNGYEYAGAGDNEGKLVSSFMAPAYLTTALSFELKKTDWSVSLSFLTGKTTFVFNDDLIDSGYTYGVIQDDDFYNADGTLNAARTYNHAYFALGSYLKAQYLKKDILPSLDLYARLELFYDYKKSSHMASTPKVNLGVLVSPNQTSTTKVRRKNSKRFLPFPISAWLPAVTTAIITTMETSVAVILLTRAQGIRCSTPY